MTDTPRLHLPQIDGQQALKHITHNEALVALDGIVQLVVQSLNVVVPEPAPVLGQVFGIATSASGAWTVKDGHLALWTEGGWRFIAPQEGWQLWDMATSALYILKDDNWQKLSEQLGRIQNATSIGVNATADDTNRLIVRSNAALFTALEAWAGGSGDTRINLNKETLSDVASLVFQTGYSGRAEIGLAGGDDFSFKVSPDGSSFKTSMTLDAANGFVTFEEMVASRISWPSVSAGSVTASTSYIVPSPETGTIDDVDTIAGGKDGALLIVSGTAGNQLTFKDGTGNLKLGSDRVLDNFEDSLMLVRRGTDWLELSFSNNG